MGKWGKGGKENKLTGEAKHQRNTLPAKLLKHLEPLTSGIMFTAETTADLAANIPRITFAHLIGQLIQKIPRQARRLHRGRKALLGFGISGVADTLLDGGHEADLAVDTMESRVHLVGGGDLDGVEDGRRIRAVGQIGDLGLLVRVLHAALGELEDAVFERVEVELLAHEHELVDVVVQAFRVDAARELWEDNGVEFVGEVAHHVLVLRVDCYLVVEARGKRRWWRGCFELDGRSVKLGVNVLPGGVGLEDVG